MPTALLNGETVLRPARAGDADRQGAAVAWRRRQRKEARTIRPRSCGRGARHPDVVQLLVETGADIRARSRTIPRLSSACRQSGPRGAELQCREAAPCCSPRASGTSGRPGAVAAGADVNDSCRTHQCAGARLTAGMERCGVPSTRAPIPMPSPLATPRPRGGVEATGLVKALLARGRSGHAHVRGTPLRRDTTDFNLPATLIGSTLFPLAARFLEPEIARACGRRRRPGSPCRTARRR
jgi:hypothetical protein